MATMADIARAVGCSLNTVSRALNDKPDVSAPTRTRIREAARRLGYAPHGPARSLVTGRTHTVGLIITNTAFPVYAILIDAVEQAVSKQGYTVLLANTRGDVRQEERALQVLREHMVEGIILRPVEGDLQRLQALRQLNLPIVLQHHGVPGLALDSVWFDYQGGAEAATSHLIGLGHRRIAFLGEEPRCLFSARERLAGYEQALAGHDITPDERLIYLGLQGIDDKAGAYEATLKLLAENPSCTAIFAYSSLVVPGVLRALQKLGRRVPADMALVGYGDYDFTPYLEVPLTCVRNPIVEMGWMASELLLRRIAGDRTGQPEEIVLAPELVVRESCGARLATGAAGPL